MSTSPGSPLSSRKGSVPLASPPRRTSSSASTSQQGRNMSSLADIDVLSLGLDEDSTSENTVDSLFQRLSVTELKAVEIKSRATANLKREELRQMVGERYRDLLSAADSIIRMHKSSNALVSNLSQISLQCSSNRNQNQQDTEKGVNTTANKNDNDKNNQIYTMAVTIKLLQDVPESVWKAIEFHDYFNAARLEGIAKITYRYVNDSQSIQLDDLVPSGGNKLTSFPLIKQQWDVISQLSSQIIKRATSSLQALPTSSDSTAHTLASLFLLDSLSIPECVDILLSSRNTCLTPLINNLETLTSKESLATAPSSSSSQRRHDGDIKQITSTISDAFELILVTLQEIFAIFVISDKTDKNSNDVCYGKLGKLLDSLQEVGGGNSNEAQEITTTTTTTTTGLIAGLQNSHLFMQYLPKQILEFTPFIDLNLKRNILSNESLNKMVKSWFDSCLDNLIKNIFLVINNISSTKRLKTLQDNILVILSSSSSSDKINSKDYVEYVETIKARFNQIVNDRISETFGAELETVLQSLMQVIDSSAKSISEEDSQISSYIFSPSIILPLDESSKRQEQEQEREGDQVGKDQSRWKFRKLINQRMQGISPKVQIAIQELERHVKVLQQDLAGGFANANLDEDGDDVDQVLRKKVQETSIEMINRIEQRLTSISTTQVKEQVLIGHISINLSQSAIFDQVFKWNNAYDKETTKKDKLVQLSSESLKTWIQESIEKSINLYVEQFTQETEFPLSETIRSSNAIIKALRTLSSSIEDVILRGLNVSRQEICLNFMQQFASRLCQECQNRVSNERSEQKSEQRFMRQLLIDVEFVENVFDKPFGDSVKIIREYSTTTDPSLIEERKRLLQNDVCRKQTLFWGLYENQDKWMPMGPSKGTSAAVDFGDLIPVAHPDIVLPRFALLPVPVLSTEQQ